RGTGSGRHLMRCVYRRPIAVRGACGPAYSVLNTIRQRDVTPAFSRERSVRHARSKPDPVADPGRLPRLLRPALQPTARAGRADAAAGAIRSDTAAARSAAAAPAGLRRAAAGARDAPC